MKEEVVPVCRIEAPGIGAVSKKIMVEQITAAIYEYSGLSSGLGARKCCDEWVTAVGKSYIPEVAAEV